MMIIFFFRYSCTSEENAKDTPTELNIKKEDLDHDVFPIENCVVAPLNLNEISNEGTTLFTCPVCRKNYTSRRSLNVCIMFIFNILCILKLVINIRYVLYVNII